MRKGSTAPSFLIRLSHSCADMMDRKESRSYQTFSGIVSCLCCTYVMMMLVLFLGGGNFPSTFICLARLDSLSLFPPIRL